MDNVQHSPEAQDATVAQPNFDNTVDIKPFKFSFRKDNLGNTRPAVEVNLPMPSVEGIAKIFNDGGKGLDTLVAIVSNAITDHVRGILSDDDAITSANFPYDQATWEAFVNVPEAEKRGRGIAKEVWTSFGEDYIAQMPALTGKKQEFVDLAAKLLLNKFQTVKTNKPVIEKLKAQLAIYLNGSPNAEQFVECVKFLDEKADLLLKLDESALLENL
jgi:hypothetical protein